MFKPLNDLLKPLTKEKIIKAKSYFIIGIYQIVIIILALSIYDSFYKTRIGVVNITGIVDEFIKVQAQRSVSPEELKKLVQTFGVSLEKELHNIGTKNHVVLMPAEAVITGAKDYTQEVQHYLSQIIPKASSKQQLQPQLQQTRQEEQLGQSCVKSVDEEQQQSQLGIDKTAKTLVQSLPSQETQPTIKPCNIEESNVLSTNTTRVI